ncbi:MAG TPA: efflux RND transporter periplasmic adaptor subunit [Prolixibacteraceae bacterium]|nr:efflux RND transporter periplasmic adaptor subunit [Prolixibacteraceae bacterium]
MKNRANILLFAILLAFASCNNRQQAETTDIASPVSVEDIKKQSIEKYINTTGTAKATQEVTLSTEMAGLYRLQNNPATGRAFKLGDRVKAGQVIVKLEDQEYVNNIAIDAQKLNLEIAEQEYEKQKSLYEKGGVTLRELRNSEVSAKNAKYNFDNAQVRISRMSIVAPFAGIITDLPYFTQGTRVTSGTAVATLMSYDKMYMEINLPEKNISDIQTGQNVIITNYTLAEDTLKGIVSELSPAISTETRTFEGKLVIDNPELHLRPGMFVKADIIVARKDSALVIPKNIILSSNRGKVVFVVEQNTARERRITIGLENQDYAEVISGLKMNERLVIKGFETLRNDSKVKVIK